MWKKRNWIRQNWTAVFLMGLQKLPNAGISMSVIWKQGFPDGPGMQ